MKGKRLGAAKFPTARIKKIMQGDDDVGKVASTTPVVISRALELFLEDILVETSSITKQSGSKKIMPHHLKRLFQTNPQYDFLLDLITSIPDPTSALPVKAAPKGDAKGKAKALPPPAAPVAKRDEDVDMGVKKDARGPVRAGLVGGMAEEEEEEGEEGSWDGSEEEEDGESY